MSTDRDLDALLPVDPVDAGCAAGFDVLHRYVDEEASGGNPAEAQPGLAAHLRACPACRADYQGLRDAAALFGDAGPT
jgi:anti-sigma factor RsiW